MNQPTTLKALNLRHEPTDAEALLWYFLKDRSFFGYKFRRQHPFSPYIVDFYCAEKKLIIELDGGHHLQQKEYDAERTRFLEVQGNKVLRFWNDEVFNRTADVFREIESFLKDYPSP